MNVEKNTHPQYFYFPLTTKFCQTLKLKRRKQKNENVWKKQSLGTINTHEISAVHKD